VHFPILIGVRRSRILDIQVGLILVLVSLVAWAFPGDQAVSAIIQILGIGLASLAWQQMKPKVCVLRLERSGELSVKRALSEDFSPAEILSGASVYPWLTVFRLRTDDQALITLTVTVDSMDAEDFRRLRLFLRWRGTSSDVTAPSDH
jgi:hypothetical protein